MIQVLLLFVLNSFAIDYLIFPTERDISKLTDKEVNALTSYYVVESAANAHSPVRLGMIRNARRVLVLGSHVNEKALDLYKSALEPGEERESIIGHFHETPEDLAAALFEKRLDVAARAFEEILLPQGFVQGEVSSLRDVLFEHGGEGRSIAVGYLSSNQDKAPSHTVGPYTFHAIDHSKKSSFLPVSVVNKKFDLILGR